MRAEILKAMLGKPWVANAAGPEAFDCFHAFAHVQKHVFDRSVAAIEVPDDPKWKWLLQAIEHHPERKRWQEVPCDRMGLIRAGDGAAVLMGHRKQAAHIGVWMKPEGRVLHADRDFGVVFERPTDLHVKGWIGIRYLEPRQIEV